MGGVRYGAGMSTPICRLRLLRVIFFTFTLVACMNPEDPTARRIWMQKATAYLPEPVSIARVGWKKFLEDWDFELLEITRAILLWEGKMVTPLDEELAAYEERTGVHLPRELHRGRIPYPGNTPEGRRLAMQAAELLTQFYREDFASMKRRRPDTLVDIFSWGDIIRNSSSGRPPATDEQIRAAEQRLGATLPPSYKEFLRLTNGWVLGDIYLTWVDRIDYLRNTEYQEWMVDMAGEFVPDDPVPDERYFNYSASQDPLTDMRREYIPGALVICGEFSDVRGIVMLNPAVVDEHGEWEAWLSKGMYDGFRRYRNFAQLMESLYLREIAENRLYADEIGANWHFR